MPKKEDWTDEATNPINVSLLPLSLEQQPSCLQMISGPGAPTTFELHGDQVGLGRSRDNDIPIRSTDLSRKHMVLKRTGPNQYTVVDLDSRNGVYLNGVKVHSALLHDGDNLQLGTVVFVYREGRNVAGGTT